MITIPRSVRIFIGKNPIDMRKSIDGLMSVVQGELRQNAYSGHLFVFISRRVDRVRIELLPHNWRPPQGDFS